jgi:multisubunit Na+/H+ antiporter MnhC subunit
MQNQENLKFKMVLWVILALASIGIGVILLIQKGILLDISGTLLLIGGVVLLFVTYGAYIERNKRNHQ